MKKLARILKYTVLSSVLILLLIGLGLGGWVYWFNNRSQPEPLAEQPIFQGVTYERVVQADPHPLIYHVIKIDLEAEGIEFFVTPSDDIEGFVYEARTVSQFLDEFDLQIAINGDFFDPFWAVSPWDYYPKSGDGVNSRGLSISEGEIATDGYVRRSAYSTMYITPDNEVIFDSPPEEIDSAISGYLRFVRDGRIIPLGTSGYLSNPHPRTAIALNQAGDTLMLFIVDGRQPNFSDGITIPDFARIIIEHGGFNALNLDGGGSSAMVMEGENGRPRQLSFPIHTRIPSRERPLGNHFGVSALRLD